MKPVMTALAAALVLLPLAASAQTRYDDPPPRDNTTVIVEPAVAEPVYRTADPMGSSVGLEVGVGVQHYGRDVSNEVNNGVGYGVILDLSPQRNFGFEINYSGGVNGISSQYSTDGRLITNQIGGDLRLNLIPSRFDLPGHLRPFIFGGAAYHRIDVQNFVPGITAANGIAIPAGVGIDSAIGGGFMLGARFTYDFIFNEMDDFSGRKADNWIAGINLGARFGG